MKPNLPEDTENHHPTDNHHLHHHYHYHFNVLLILLYDTEVFHRKKYCII